ncbi:MAG: TIGR03862 family flavoprotein [Pseudomonadota bacterium]
MMDCLIVGGGPAGLMAADVISAEGRSATVIEKMPSLGRKFLMAGKSGLNLTRDETLNAFIDRYPEALANIKQAVSEFGPEQVRAFATALDQVLFTGSTGRVFPKVMKASPMLRAWIARLSDQGVTFRTRTTWMHGLGNDHTLSTLRGEENVHARTVLFAMGGGSWARLGSDGAWAKRFAQMNIATTPFQPSNVGVVIPWSSHMRPHIGSPLKATRFSAGGRVHEGEAVVSTTGLEGGAIYNASAALRKGAQLKADLCPDLSRNEILERLASIPPKVSQANVLRKALGLSPAKQALLNEFHRPLPKGPDLAHLLKNMAVLYSGFAPIDGAISTAGGLAADALSEDFMIADRPGWFAAGEMIDWDAPTGGYLLTACFATGQRAGRGVLDYLA